MIMDVFMCYGLVVFDGYGVCYNLYLSWILVCIILFKWYNDINFDYFVYILESSLL